MTTVFTEEEMILLASGSRGNRMEAIAWLKEMYHTVEDDADMQELIEEVISKLIDITDEEYLQIDLSGYDTWIGDMQDEIDQELAEIPDDANGAE